MPKTNVGDDEENCYRQGLFGNVYDGEVKNLGIENADIIVISMMHLHMEKVY